MFAVNTLKRLFLVCVWCQLPLSGMLTALGKFLGFKFWCSVNRMHVDSNSFPQKKSVLNDVLSVIV